MKLSNLFTQSGLFEAIKAHHKHLHEQYNFPPLKGMKSVHKFAELFDLKNAEQLKHALLSNKVTSSSVAVHFGNGDNPQVINVYIEESDNTLRVQQEGESDFVIFSLLDNSVQEMKCNSPEKGVHCVTMGNVQVVLKLHQHPTKQDNNFISATIIECPVGEKIDHTKNLSNHIETEHELNVMDYQTCEVLDNQKAEESTTTYILVCKQEDRLYTTAHRTYNSALAEFRENIKEDLDTHDAHTGYLDFSCRDYTECGTDEDLIADKLNSIVDNMTEEELSSVYSYIHEDALGQINPTTLS